jgi:hypothetical protein
MTDIELLVREALGRHESEVPLPDPLETHAVAVRGRRRQVLNAIGAGLVALVIVLGTVSGVSALLRAEGRRPADGPTPSPTVAPNPQPTDQTRGIFGLPPEGAEPSLPEVGELVIIVDNFSRPLHSSVYVYADGRVLSLTQTIDEYTDTGGWLEQRISPTGVDLLHSELIASGLFEKNLAFKDVAEVTISVRNGDRFVRLQGSSAQGRLEATSQQTRTIEELARIFGNLEAWLPQDAWTDREPRAFVPSRYRVSLDFAGVGNRTPKDPSSLPAAAEELLIRAERVNRFGSCQLVTTEEARSISAELSTNADFDVFRAPPRENEHGAITFVIVGGTLPAGFPGSGIVYLRPALPHEVGCR